MAINRNAPTAREIRIAVALTALLLFLPVVGIATRPQLQITDFQVLYLGGTMLREGHASRLYDLGEQERVQEGFMHQRGLVADPYPPFHALLFAPLTLLGYRNAYLAWGAINVLLWVGFDFITRRELGTRIQPFRYLLLNASFFPLWLALMEGQTSLLLLLSFILTFVCLKRNRDYAAGFALGLGLIKFQTVLPLALIFVLRRNWKLIAGLAAATGLLSLLSVVTIGPSGILSYAHLMVDTMRHPNPVFLTMNLPNMPTIGGFITCLLTGTAWRGWIGLLSAVFSCSVILFIAWRWRQASRSGERYSFDLMFAAAVVGALLSSPHVWNHDLTVMLPAMVILIGSPQWLTRSPNRLFITMAISILYAVPLYYVWWGAPFVLAPALVIFLLATLSLARGGAKQGAAGGQIQAV